MLGVVSRLELKKRIIMTLKKLLDSLTFDEIAPYILIRNADCYDAAGTLALYKLHFDYLRGLVPTNPELLERKESHISLRKDKDKTYLDAFSLEGEIWADALSRELVLDREVNACNAEIAACCLWHMSFYGFLPYQCEETFEDMFDGIEKKRALLKSYKEKFHGYIPSKREMFAIPSFHNAVMCEMKFYRRQRITKQDREDEEDRSWNKRCWRGWKRRIINCEYIERVNYCSSFINRVTELLHGADWELALHELSKLYHSNHVSVMRLDSLANNAAERFDYLKELIEKYDATNIVSRYSNSFVCLSASSANQITEREKTIVDFLTKGLSGTHKLYVMVDDSCDEEMRIDVAYYE